MWFLPSALNVKVKQFNAYHRLMAGITVTLLMYPNASNWVFSTVSERVIVSVKLSNERHLIAEKYFSVNIDSKRQTPSLFLPMQFRHWISLNKIVWFPEVLHCIIWLVNFHEQWHDYFDFKVFPPFFFFFFFFFLNFNELYSFKSTRKHKDELIYFFFVFFFVLLFLFFFLVFLYQYKTNKQIIRYLLQPR